MNLFHDTFCPICNLYLVKDYTKGFNLYDCPASKTPHYFYSEQEGTLQPVYAAIRIPVFYLHLSPIETTIYKFKGPEEAEYKFVCTIQGHFPLDWNDLSKATKRINNLIVFS